MFYTIPPEIDLRFGDVINGYVCVTPKQNPSNTLDTPSILDIELRYPKYYAVMTPCCSIKDCIINVAPLESIKRKYFDNPHLSEDLLRINEIVAPEYSVPPIAWTRMGVAQKEKRLEEGSKYILSNIFVYNENDRLSEYELNMGNNVLKKTRYYQIDFKKMFCIKSTEIENNRHYPFEIKLLQLSNFNREVLRQKIGDYFSRVPAEDN